MTTIQDKIMKSQTEGKGIKLAISDKAIEEVIRIMCWADSGCAYCSSGLINKFIEKFKIDKKVAKEIIIKVAKEEDVYWKDELEDYFDFITN